MPTFTVRQIAERVGGDIDGPAEIEITGLAELAQAQPGQLSFVRDDRHLADWASSRAAAALVTRSLTIAAGAGRAIIRVGDADLAMAAVLELFAPPPPRDATRPGVHAQATVDPSARIDATACIAAGVRIGPRVVVGARCVIHANVVILDDATVGADALLYPGVVIRERCELGDRVILHPNVVIGADGFGYRPAPGGQGLIKIPHIGHVIIESDVEIGACSCVDRGKFSATVIGAGTKIDNLCQIAHNCRLGRCCVIAGNAGLAGSVTLGDGVMIGGGTSVKDHLSIGAGAQIAGASAVLSNVPAGETWGGYPARPLQQTLRELAALRRLPELVRLMKKMERKD